jgi:hypothetical protein
MNVILYQMSLQFDQMFSIQFCDIANLLVVKIQIKLLKSKEICVKLGLVVILG